MEYRKLGKTGMNVSLIAFGAASLGNVFGPVDEEEAASAVHCAIENGINYFDVAPLYGFTLAEERLGRALQGKRNDIFLATKCCRDTFTEVDFSARRVEKSIDESLIRLKTDYVDVLQIHDVEFADRRQVIEETVPAARRLQEKGKCRFVGITGLPVRYLRFLAEQVEIDTCLSWGHYTLVEDELDEELTPVCRERGIGLINASPLMQRLLTDGDPPEWHRSPAPVLEAAAKIAALCRRYGQDTSLVAMRHALNYPHVGTTIVGMSKVRHVETNLKALEIDVPEELFEKIKEIAAPAKNMMWFEGRDENNIPPKDPDRYVPRKPDQTH